MFSNILGSEFNVDNQRDEVFLVRAVARSAEAQVVGEAFLVTWRRGQPQPDTPVRPHQRPRAGGFTTFQQLFDQWLQARQLPPSPDPFPQFSSAS